MAAGSTDDTSPESALSLAEQLEAEAEQAEAEAAAARARAAALQAGADPSAEPEGPTESEEQDYEAALAALPESSGPDIALWHVIAAAAAAVVLVALVAAAGFLAWAGHQATAERDREAEFAAAARQGVVNLMSLNYTTTDEDLQRLIDSTTGEFRADFEKSRDSFKAVMNESKVITEADVKATAVEKMTEDTATVLVAATSKVSNVAAKEQQPRAWRLSIDLARDGDQIKMSKVEFVP
jgi:Mce-associated membrane protein